MLDLKTTGRALGIVVQVVVLGQMLFFAVVKLFALETGAQVFRYAGF